MNNISKNARGALLVGILGPVLFALGNLVPLVKTSLGLSYGVNGDSNAALCVYAAVVALLLVNILSDKMQADIAKRLQILAVLIACGMLVFGLYLSKGGVEWFNVQRGGGEP